MKLYHGTKYEYNAKLIEEEGLHHTPNGESGPGVYLTPDVVVAKHFALRWKGDKPGDNYNGHYEPGIVFEADVDTGKILDRNTREGEALFREIQLEGPGDELHKRLMAKGYGAVSHDSGFPEIVILDKNKVPIPKRIDPDNPDNTEPAVSATTGPPEPDHSHADDPFSAHEGPPLHPNCRCRLEFRVV